MMRMLLISMAAATLMGNPVQRVVGLLTDMQNKLETEKKQDEDLYEKMQCWCTTNEKEKGAAVEIAGSRITSLTNSIETGVAKSAELKANIVRLEKDIAKNMEALSGASALRTKENGEFVGEEADLAASLESVTNAVAALSSQHGFMQSGEALVQVKAAVHRAMAGGKLSAQQKTDVQSLLAQPVAANSYNSRSGAIFGIMSQMKETFTTDLEGSRADEARAQSEFEELSSAKKDEISSAKTMKNDKTTELAETAENLANDKHDLELTNKALSTDQAFLADLTARCAKSDADFTARTTARAAEIAGVQETIGILTDDAARDLFNNQLGFVQIQASDRRAHAVVALKKLAMKSGSTSLLALAATARLDSFENVKKEIDSMVSALKKEMADETEHRDFCIKEITKNEFEQKDKNGEIADLEVNIADLEASIDTLASEIKELEAQVSEMQVQIKRASEDRAAENKEFQQTVADQRATQMILAKAAARMEEVYAPKEEETQESFLQQEPGAAAPPPPSDFKEYKQNDSAGGVMGLLNEIIADTKRMEEESLMGEQDSQSSYEAFVADTGKSIAAANRSIVQKQEEKAAKEASAASDKSSHKAAGKALASLKEYNGQLHSSCDYVMKNYGARQEARGQEIDSLGQVKAILSGA